MFLPGNGRGQIDSDRRDRAILGFRVSRDLIRTGETRASVSAFLYRTLKNIKNALCDLGLRLRRPAGFAEITYDHSVCRINGSR
jgi:DNA repair ATPase RecN